MTCMWSSQNSGDVKSTRMESLTKGSPSATKSSARFLPTEISSPSIDRRLVQKHLGEVSPNRDEVGFRCKKHVEIGRGVFKPILCAMVGLKSRSDCVKVLLGGLADAKPLQRLVWRTKWSHIGNQGPDEVPRAGLGPAPRGQAGRGGPAAAWYCVFIWCILYILDLFGYIFGCMFRIWLVCFVIYIFVYFFGRRLLSGALQVWKTCDIQKSYNTSNDLLYCK